MFKTSDVNKRKMLHEPRMQGSEKVGRLRVHAGHLGRQFPNTIAQTNID